MRQLMFGLGALAAVVTAADAQSSRAPRPYCLDAERTHLRDCSYYTFQQCLDTAHGLGGICYENPLILWQQRASGAQPESQRKAKKRSQ